MLLLHTCVRLLFVTRVVPATTQRCGSYVRVFISFREEKITWENMLKCFVPNVRARTRVRLEAANWQQTLNQLILPHGPRRCSSGMWCRHTGHRELCLSCTAELYFLGDVHGSPSSCRRTRSGVLLQFLCHEWQRPWPSGGQSPALRWCYAEAKAQFGDRPARDPSFRRNTLH